MSGRHTLGRSFTEAGENARAQHGIVLAGFQLILIVVAQSIQKSGGFAELKLAAAFMGPRDLGPSLASSCPSRNSVRRIFSTFFWQYRSLVALIDYGIDHAGFRNRDGLWT